MPFYPDNVKRAGRLQQLVDSMANMQTDIKDFSEQMDRKLKRMQAPLDKLLVDEGIDSIERLLEKSEEVLSPGQEKAYRALINAAKDSSQRLDWPYLLGSLLSLPILGKTLNAQAMAGIGRFAVRAGGLEAISKFFTAAQEAGAPGVAQAAQALIKASEESEKALEAAAKTAEATGVETKVAAEVAEAGQLVGKVAVCVRVLAVIGFVATIIMGIIEVVQGADQKKKLIQAIHDCQPARLCIAFFKAEAEIILQQAELIVTYVEFASEKKEDPESKKAAEKIGSQIIKKILDEDLKIDWRKLEKNLEAQDKKSESFYGDDDLDFYTVLNLARVKEREARDGDDTKK
ncbi:hypothetical protein B0H14DRAFT_2851496 [Mycena olivaceomarginata]|nr:hypothetical protein B0H14DRAFT_2851496 [Mycena olivaceomarginata]